LWRCGPVALACLNRVLMSNGEQDQPPLALRGG
jgi:hypothetical protein